MKKWILTDTFDFHSKDAHYWEFDDFDNITNEEVGYKLIKLLKVCNCQENKK